MNRTILIPRGYIICASRIEYKGYTHRYPTKTVRVIPIRKSGPKGHEIPIVGRRHYVNYKTYRGLYPTHPFDTVCIRKRRDRHCVWSCEDGVVRGGGGRLGHHRFLGLLNINATATSTTLCKYDPGQGRAARKKAASRPSKRVAFQAGPAANSGISVLNCNYVHLPALNSDTPRKRQSSCSRRVMGHRISCTLTRKIGCFSASPTCYQKLSRHVVNVTLEHRPHGDCFVTAGLSGFSRNSEAHRNSLRVCRHSVGRLRISCVSCVLLRDIKKKHSDGHRFRRHCVSGNILSFLLRRHGTKHVHGLKFSFRKSPGLFSCLLSGRSRCG